MPFVAEDLDAMARTVYGEARSESFLGQAAVGFVIRNRAAKGGWWGKTIKAVCYAPKQFSCHNPTDPNRRRCRQAKATDPAFQSSLAAAAAVLAGLIEDPTGGATHYHATSIPPPAWAVGKTPTVTIGAHAFYRDID